MIEEVRATPEVRAPSGLVLPEPGVANTRLASLRRAEAWRLLKAHAATGDLRAARPLADVARSAPEVAVDVLMDPAAAVLARCARPAEAGDTWMLELARRGAPTSRFEVRGRQLISLPLDLRIAWTAGVKLTLSARVLELTGGGPARTIPLERDALLAARDPRLAIDEPFRALRPGIRFALADPNPLAMVEAHPDKAGNALSLGDRDEGEWTRALDGALAIVERHLPDVVGEMRALSMLLVPVGYEPQKHLSASYREYVGACYLTLHPDVRTMAEAIVHEFQHNKANLASYHDPLLENALGTMVRSPVRPDLRPIWGVLLAVHAFVPVAELYRRMLASGAPTLEDARIQSRLADVIARNDEGLRTLREHAEPTRVGAMLLEELEALHAEHLALELARPEGVSWEG